MIVKRYVGNKHLVSFFCKWWWLVDRMIGWKWVHGNKHFFLSLVWMTSLYFEESRQFLQVKWTFLSFIGGEEMSIFFVSLCEWPAYILRSREVFAGVLLLLLFFWGGASDLLPKWFVLSFFGGGGAGGGQVYCQNGLFFLFVWILGFIFGNFRQFLCWLCCVQVPPPRTHTVTPSLSQCLSLCVLWSEYKNNLNFYPHPHLLPLCVCRNGPGVYILTLVSVVLLHTFCIINDSVLKLWFKKENLYFKC